ncbi:MAG TPA: hypothetical protein ENN44_02760 [Methanoculleus sp.]|nr:hypothetical protein [Methanoculleus sp.]
MRGKGIRETRQADRQTDDGETGMSPFALAILILGGLLILCAFLITPAAAHVPLTSGGNDHIDDAFPVPDPTKSWVVYGELEGGGDVRYYRMAMATGDELRLSLFTPRGAPAFVPGIVVMGPDLAPSGTLPPFVDMPPHDHAEETGGDGHATGGAEADEYGAVVIGGTVPDGAEFEPFTPSALYHSAEYSHMVRKQGTYYVAVYAPEGSASGGNYGLAVGYREEFTLSEWLLVPFSVLAIHRWEGQSWALILGPLVLTLVGGFGLLLWRGRREGMSATGPGTGKGPAFPIRGPFGWLAVTAGLLYIGTGVMLLVQTAIALGKAGLTGAAVLPVIYLIVAVLLGSVALRNGLHHTGRTGWGTKNAGLSMIFIGVVGFVAWAGLLAGPVMAVVAGIGALVWGERSALTR